MHKVMIAVASILKRNANMPSIKPKHPIHTANINAKGRLNKRKPKNLLNKLII